MSRSDVPTTSVIHAVDESGARNPRMRIPLDSDNQIDGDAKQKSVEVLRGLE